MDKEWAQMNKEMQALLSKESTFRDAIRKLFELRESLFLQITQIVDVFPEEAFSRMPFAGAEGYHSKTLAYSIWHIFRIEDIVAHEMIAEDRQVFLQWILINRFTRRSSQREMSYAEMKSPSSRKNWT